MLVIHKFGPYTPGEELELEFNKLVHFGEQDGELYVWAQINEDNPAYNKKRSLLIIGTGWDYEHEFTHKMSMIDDGGLVWHLMQYGCIEEFANRMFN